MRVQRNKHNTFSKISLKRALILTNSIFLSSVVKTTLPLESNSSSLNVLTDQMGKQLQLGDKMNGPNGVLAGVQSKIEGILLGGIMQSFYGGSSDPVSQQARSQVQQDQIKKFLESKTKVIEHDFKVGGKWKYAMPMPDGNEFISEGTYKEIVPLEKIFTSADFKPMTENVELQCYFEADGDKTKFTFKVIHATAAYCKQQEEMGFYNGWGSTLERFETVLSSLC